MPTATAKIINIPVSARKARLVADMIRGKRVADARAILRYTLKASADPIRKLLDSAVANAENAAAEKRERVDTDEFVVSHIAVNQGFTLRRFRPASRGRATPIRKRHSHVELAISSDK
jgi:large subunit ribosomal protein L22